jgi:hypothetical protein
MNVVTANDIIANFVEIEFAIRDGFRIVKETLKRVGFVDDANLIIYPQCYLFHKKEIYYIVHRKELQLLNNVPNIVITKEDINIRNKIVKLLEKFNLVASTNIPKNSYGLEDDNSYINFTFLKKEDFDKYDVDKQYNIF